MKIEVKITDFNVNWKRTKRGVNKTCKGWKFYKIKEENYG